MKYLTLLAFLFSGLTLSAQSVGRNSFKVAAGVSRHVQEQVSSPSILLAFAKDFYPRTLIEIDATWVNPVDVSTLEETRKLKSYRFGMSFLFKVLEERKQAFNVGLGFSGGFYGTDYVIFSTAESGSNNEFSPGFAAIIEYHFILPSQWFIGARASTSRYGQNRRALFLAATLGYRF